MIAGFVVSVLGTNCFFFAFVVVFVVVSVVLVFCGFVDSVLGTSRRSASGG